jgi:hypothetical protein
MTEQHSITPPQDKFKRWEDDILNERENVDVVLDCAWKDGFRAGADQELEAVIAWMEKMRYWGYDKAISDLRAARRPSLKEQALKALAAIEGDFNTIGDRAKTIRRAIEQLPD